MKVDLGSQTYASGKIGSVTPLCVVPVVAGDSIAMRSLQVMEMRPFVRGIVLDAQIDTCTFFVPHRHIYGADWIKFLREGRDTSVVFPERTTSHIPRFIPWLERQDNLPAWLADGYFKIWNRYFRPPNQGIAEINEMPSTLPAEWREFGYPAAHLPAVWNGGIETQPTDAQRELDVSGGTLDLIDLADKANEYASQLDRDWMGNYYSDMLKVVWHGHAGTDADQRPTLVWHDTQMSSGQNIYGTSGSNLASNAGKSHAVVNHSFPKRFFGEHGALWTVQVVRFEPVHQREIHFLSASGKTSYGEFACDPRYISGQPPVLHNVQDFFDTQQTNDLFYQGFGQWYRSQPNWVSYNVENLDAYPFMSSVPADYEDTSLVKMQDYDKIFQGGGQFHWEARTGFDVSCDRAIPSTMSTAYTGAP